MATQVLRLSFIVVCLLALNLHLVSVARAGATSSSWVIVVNGDSINSRTIANHYVHLRDIPDRNVIVLSGLPAGETINHTVFIEQILKPVFQAVEQRGLANHIQGIAYSCDIPTRINFPAIKAADSPIAKYLTNVASINSATYLYQIVLAQDQTPIGLMTNFYCRLPVEQTMQLPISPADREAIDAKLDSSRPKSSADSSDESDESDDVTLDDLLDQLQEEPKTAPEVDEAFLKAYVELHPYQNVAWIKLAELAAKEHRDDDALAYIEKAIGAGWSYARPLRNNPAFFSLATNSQFQTLMLSAGDDPIDWTEPRSFDARASYTPNGIATNNPAAGVRYMLSMVLASTTAVGNTMDEAIECLRLAKSADQTFPTGTFYFTSTADVRTTCRQQLFDVAIDKLKGHGFGAEKISTTLPVRKLDCLGVTMGTATYSWITSSSKLTPGAIVDNLTSLGGQMDGPSQTKISEALRSGAAAASGAVTEPYSLQPKFPLPFLHESYARGNTLAEAFYENLMGPYQLLIVGDPLCQPWTKLPGLQVDGIVSGETVSKATTLRAAVSDGALSSQLMLLIDGVPKAAGASSLSANIDPADGKTNGCYNIRIIAQATDAMNAREEQSFWLKFGSDVDAIKLQVPEVMAFEENASLTVAIATKITEDVSIFHHTEEVAKIAAGQREVTIPMKSLGKGPVRLHSKRLFKGQPQSSMPVEITLN